MVHLRLDEVNAFYETSHVLHDITLKVEEGTLVTLIGRNGAGKTTTLRSIIGTVEREGVIEYKGVDISDENPYEIAQRGIAMIPEERRLFPHLSVSENLRIGHLGHDQPKDVVAQQLEQVFEYFPRLDERREQRAGQMSGGEQQMLAIARGLMSDPKLLLIDEPSEGLMPTLVEKIEDIITRLNKSGMTILLVEQSVNMALRISDYGYVIDEGQIKYEGPSTELRNNEEIKSRYLAVG